MMTMMEELRQVKEEVEKLKAEPKDGEIHNQMKMLGVEDEKG